MLELPLVIFFIIIYCDYHNSKVQSYFKIILLANKLSNLHTVYNKMIAEHRAQAKHLNLLPLVLNVTVWEQVCYFLFCFLVCCHSCFTPSCLCSSVYCDWPPSAPLCLCHVAMFLSFLSAICSPVWVKVLICSLALDFCPCPVLDLYAFFWNDSCFWLLPASTHSKTVFLYLNE